MALRESKCPQKQRVLAAVKRLAVDYLLDAGKRLWVMKCAAALQDTKNWKMPKTGRLKYAKVIRREAEQLQNKIQNESMLKKNCHTTNCRRKRCLAVEHFEAGVHSRAQAQKAACVHWKLTKSSGVKAHNRIAVGDFEAERLTDKWSMADGQSLEQKVEQTLGGMPVIERSLDIGKVK